MSDYCFLFIYYNLVISKINNCLFLLSLIAEISITTSLKNEPQSNHTTKSCFCWRGKGQNYATMGEWTTALLNNYSWDFFHLKTNYANSTEKDSKESWIHFSSSEYICICTSKAQFNNCPDQLSQNLCPAANGELCFLRCWQSVSRRWNEAKFR